MLQAWRIRRSGPTSRTSLVKVARSPATVSRNCERPTHPGGARRPHDSDTPAGTAIIFKFWFRIPRLRMARAGTCQFPPRLPHAPGVLRAKPALTRHRRARSDKCKACCVPGIDVKGIAQSPYIRLRNPRYNRSRALGGRACMGNITPPGYPLDRLSRSEQQHPNLHLKQT